MNVEHDGKRRRRSLWRNPALLAAVLVFGLWIASRVVEGWRWPPGAFVVVGVLILTMGFLYEWVTRNRDSLAYRAAVGIAAATGFVLLWSSLVRSNDVTPRAALHFGVPLVGLIGAALARLRPKGMARALWATALAQVLVSGVVGMLPGGLDGEVGARTPAEWRGLFGSAVIAVLFAAAALLFRMAWRGESAAGADAALASGDPGGTGRGGGGNHRSLE